MHKKIILILANLSFFLFLVSCLKSKGDGNRKVLFSVNTSVKQEIDSCFEAIKGVNMYFFDYNDMDNLEKPCVISNAVRLSYKDTSDCIFSNDKPYYAYAYLDANDLVINISETFLGNLTEELIIKISSDQFFSSLFKITRNGKESGQYQTEKEILVLEKKSYSLGDTINGYAFYQGLETTMKKRRWKFKFYFSCILQKEKDLQTIVKTFPKCKLDE